MTSKYLLNKNHLCPVCFTRFVTYTYDELWDHLKKEHDDEDIMKETYHNLHDLAQISWDFIEEICHGISDYRETH